jgi:acyl carrier protein
MMSSSMHTLKLPHEHVSQGKMTPADVEATCRAIVATILEIDESLIQPSSRFREDLGADSLDMVTLIMAVSRVFEANICDREVHHIDTYGEAVAYLERHLVPKDEPES